jgi:hypothetical protein
MKFFRNGWIERDKYERRALADCHPRCALGPDRDHPGYMAYRCVDADGHALLFPDETGYEESLA